MLPWQTLRRGPHSRAIRYVRQSLPPLNFITIHYAYFIGTCMLSAIIFWGASTPAKSVSFTNSLYLVVSAISGAGLNTVNLSTLNTFQQFMLFVLIMIGSPIFVSAFVVLVRKRAFEKKFNDFVESEQQRHRGRPGVRGRRWSSASRSKTRHEQDLASTDLQASPSGQLLANGNTEKAADGTLPTSDSAPATAERPPAAVEDEPLQLTDSSENERRRPPTSVRRNPTAITFSGDTRFQSGRTDGPALTHRHKFLAMQGVGALHSSSLHPISPSRPSSTSVHRGRSGGVLAEEEKDGREFETAGGRVARNSQFHGLTEKERLLLGGYEYRAVSFLAWVVPAYFILWQLLSAIGCAAWVAINRPSSARENGLNPWWVGAFNAVSAFNNSGMSLLDANMTAYQTAYYLLITMGMLILAGNTCYPILLRLIVWSMYKVSKRLETRSEAWSERASTLRFLLDHPRRCYTNMFPSQHTWWLLFSVVTLNGIDWAAFEILNIGNKQLDSLLPTGVRVIDGLFQAFAVRSGGFYIVDIPILRISLQVLYVVMMYISVYPVTITMRNSNVYEERSLGIYADDQEDQDGNPLEKSRSRDGQPRRSFLSRLSGHLVTGGANAKESNGHFVRQQIRAQLAHDAWWIVTAVFLVMIIEAGQFERDPALFSVFNFIFEIVSAYGCVGISVGVPYADYSFSGSWRKLSKLILCAVMLRGRHRGLPVAIDKAVLLPGEKHWLAEEDDGRIRLARTMSRGPPEAV